jgi:SNF2 family DNA or RNA helicase
LQRGKNEFAFFLDMGCLAGDAEVEVSTGGAAQTYKMEALYRLCNKIDVSNAQEKEFSRPVHVKGYRGSAEFGFTGVRAVLASGVKPVYALGVGSRQVKLTLDHEVFTERGFVPYHNLSLKHDRVLTDEGYLPITGAALVDVEETYDIVCEPPHRNFLANGIVVHNCGKTSLVVNVAREKYYEHKRILRTLVVCPDGVTGGWLKEYKAHASPKVSERVVVLSGTGKERLRLFESTVAKWEGNCVIVVNYESLSMQPLYAALRRWLPEIVVVDESQRIKNPDAKRSELIWALGDSSKYRYVLSGTPFTNSLLDVFSQYRFLDKGETFTESYYRFRARYFHDKNAGMPSNRHFPNWQPLPGVESELRDLIFKKAVRVMKKDCLDLPPFTRLRVETKLGSDQAKAYEEMRDDFITFLEGDAVTAELAITKSLRLQQILSGYAITDETGEAKRFEKVPRLDTLGEIIEDLPADAKFVIWACFRENYKDLVALVEKLGISCVQLVGGLGKERRDDALQRFVNDPKTRAMVANPASAGVGVDGMQVANYAIYFSRSFNLEHDLQSNDRIYRGGSERHKNVTRIDIVAPGTIDEAILESLAAKQSMAEAVLAWRSALVRA